MSGVSSNSCYYSSLFISNTISFSQFTHIESSFFQYQKSTTENPIRITCQKINPIPHRKLETHHETHLYIVKLANLLRQTFLHNPHEHRRLPVNCHKVLHQVIIHNYCICWLYVFICFTALCFFSFYSLYLSHNEPNNNTRASSAH